MISLRKSIIYNRLHYSSLITRIKANKNTEQSSQCTYCNAAALQALKEKSQFDQKDKEQSFKEEIKIKEKIESNSCRTNPVVERNKSTSSSSPFFTPSSASRLSSSSTSSSSISQQKGSHDNRDDHDDQDDDDDGEENKKKPIPPGDLPILKDPFLQVKEKNKNVYLQMVDVFMERSVDRRNHVEFIYAALKHMKTYGVERDLDVYKALINVMPKGKFIPTNIFQAEFMHYPKQQQCIIDLLEQMEDLGVMPDTEMETMLLNVFGKYGHPLRKYWRMMYWMPKFKNLSPWPLPNIMPNDAQELAKLAVERMCSVDLQSTVSVYETKILEDAVDNTWIVSGISPEQSRLLKEHSNQKPIYIEGPFTIWLRNRTINYFTLRADADLDLLEKLNSINKNVDKDDVTGFSLPFFDKYSNRLIKNILHRPRSVHQQDDGTILAICATGTSSKDSLLSWIRLLEKNGNVVLGQIPILFRFRSKVGEKEKEIGAQSALTTSRSLNNENNSIKR